MIPLLPPTGVLATSILMLAETAKEAPSNDLNTLVSGGSVGGVAAALVIILKIVIDKTLPGRSDQRANVQLLLESLNNTIKILQEEKSADAKRLEDKQTRIDALENEAEKDYDRISELRAEIIDLRQRLAVKDRHINALVSQLRRVGILVTGIELEDQNLEITFTRDEIQQAKDSTPERY